MEDDRWTAEARIKQLGGQVSNDKDWDDDATHVVCYDGPNYESYPTFEYCGLAAGRYALLWKYIEDSWENRRWKREAPYVVSFKVLFRVDIFNNNGWIKAGVFWDVRACFILSDWYKGETERLSQIIQAGNGTVVTRWKTFRDFLDDPPAVHDITHLFIEGFPAIVYSEVCTRVRNRLNYLGASILHYQYVITCVQNGGREKCDSEGHWLVTSRFVEELVELELSQFSEERQAQLMKRPVPPPPPPITLHWNGKQFKRMSSSSVSGHPPVITLDSDDVITVEDEDVVSK